MKLLFAMLCLFLKLFTATIGLQLIVEKIETSADPELFEISMNFTVANHITRFNYSGNLLQDLKRYYVSILLSDYANDDRIYFNYTINPCQKHFGNFVSQTLFKDMPKFGNTTLGCPQRKGLRELTNFVLDTSSIPRVLPLNMKLAFQNAYLDQGIQGIGFSHNLAMKAPLALLFFCVNLTEISCIYNFIPDKAPDLEMKPELVTATLDYVHNRTHHELNFIGELLQDLKWFYVTIILLDYGNNEIIYLNYTFNPCLKNNQLLACAVVFKDLTSPGNLNMECPAKKGNRFQSNFSIDMIKIPSNLPLKLKLSFWIILSTVKTVNRFNKVIPILTAKFAGKIVSS